MTMLAKAFLIGSLSVFAGSLAGCADGGGGGDDLLVVVNGGPNYNCESDDSVLDGAQCSWSELVDDLAAILNGTQLEGFIQCLDPLGSDVIEGPDSVLDTLLTALAEQSASPEEMEAALMDMATALASLGDNLPNALLALSGDNEAIAACNNGGGGGGGGGDPLDPGQLAAFCAIPTIGPALVEGLGENCP